MALNLQAFKTRAITAVVFVIVMLFGLLWDRWSLVLLFTIINFGCWWEYFKLVEKINAVKISEGVKYFFLSVSGIIMYCAAFPYYSFDKLIMISGNEVSVKYLFLVIAFLLLVIFVLQNRQVPSKAKWMCFAGFLYITLPCILIIDLRTYFSLQHRDVRLEVLPCGIIFSIWINDTMAYIVGSMIGKTPFSKISAKKTWEGTIGGALLCIVVIALLGWWTKFYTVQDWIMIAAICAVFGTLGDLLESKLKRLAGVKDSGAIMPGHGGFLDRFDSLLVATPLVWLYVYFFIR
jgi:phosphatidate cytidylyltransferase